MPGGAGPHGANARIWLPVTLLHDGETALQRARSLVTAAVPLDMAVARIILFNVLFARQTGGTVEIRLDDTRDGAAADDTVADDLAWLGLAPGVDVVQTSALGSVYLDVARRLVSSGRAVEAQGALVLRIAPGETVVEDAVKGRVTFTNEVLGDFIVVDAGGAVNPLFAAAFDAARFGTTFVLREDRELERTALQQHVFAALDVPPPRSAHIGMLLPDTGELPTIARLRRAGIQPAALVNHLALLGWSPRSAQESFSLAELVAAFSLDRLSPDPAHLNEARLYALNARALRALTREQLGVQLMTAMQRVGLLETPVPQAARRWVDTFLAAYGNEFATLTQALELVADLRAEAVTLPAFELEKLRNRQVVFYLDAVGQYVDAQAELRDLPLAHDLPAIASEFGIAHADALAAVRMALTGRHAGPQLELLFPLLGHDRILIRIGAISSHLLHGRGLEPIKYGPGGVPFETIRAERPM